MANEIKTLFNSTTAKPDWRIDWKEDAKLDWKVDWAVDTGQPVNTVLPAIDDLSPNLAQTLTVTSGTWTGTATISYTYQWYRAGVAIPGATATTYVTTTADANNALTVEVQAVNAKGAAEVTTVAANTSVPVNTVAPAVTGTAQVGETLTSDTGTFTSGATVSYVYSWFRDDVLIAGATASTYVLVEADLGAVINSKVVATNFAGSAVAVASNDTAIVIAA